MEIEEEIDVREILGEGKISERVMNFKYKLKSIVIYKGTGSGGHYYGVFKKEDKWEEINDGDKKRTPRDAGANTRRSIFSNAEQRY